MTIYLKRFLLIVLLSFLWNIIIPGIVAYKDKVYFFEEIEIKLPAHSKGILTKYQNYKQKQNLYKTQIEKIDQKLSLIATDDLNNSDINSLINLRTLYSTELDALISPIVLGPYNNNRSVFYTLTTYIFLGILVFLILRYSLPKKKFFLRLLTLSLGLYILWMFTNWLRNFIFYDEGRTLFVYVNYDISPISFWLQEFRILGICFLIALLWLKLNEMIINQKKEMVLNVDEAINHSTLVRYAKELTKLFTTWQIASVVIVLTFLPWTLLYWTNISKYSDYRYFIPAMVIHVYWAITWILLTIPVIKTYNLWNEAKNLYLLNITVNKDDTVGFDKQLTLLKEINPLSTTQIIGAGIGSIISFLLPFINLLFK